MNDERMTISEDTLRGANDYIPLLKKDQIAKAIAGKCLRISRTADQNKAGEKMLAMPCIYVEDTATKEMYQMEILLRYYLGIDIGEEFTDEMYDFYGRSHILNQLERFKGYAELKNKVFDLLSDYSKMKKFLDVEIYNEKTIRNDGLARTAAAISVVATPENIRAMIEELKAEEMTMDGGSGNES